MHVWLIPDSRAFVHRSRGNHIIFLTTPNAIPCEGCGGRDLDCSSLTIDQNTKRNTSL
jgi:hypothetical protein